MPNLTIYLPDEIADAVTRRAKREKTSASRWVAGVITRHLKAGPRPGVLAALGAIPDFPSIEDLRSGYGEDTPREELR